MLSRNRSYLHNQDPGNDRYSVYVARGTSPSGNMGSLREFGRMIRARTIWLNGLRQGKRLDRRRLAGNASWVDNVLVFDANTNGLALEV